MAHTKKSFTESRVIVFFDGLKTFNVFNQYAERTTVVVGAFRSGHQKTISSGWLGFAARSWLLNQRGLRLVVLDIEKIYWEVCNRFVALPTGAILFFIGSGISFLLNVGLETELERN